MSDLRPAFRVLRRTPWYCATVIGVVALGMALTTTVFAVVDGVLFKPLPYARIGEVFGVSPGVLKAGGTHRGLGSVSIAHLRAWREAAHDVHFSAFNTSGAELTLGGDPVEFALVDADFLDVLGQRPLVGGFRPEHFGPRGPVWAVLISYGFWQRAFGGDPGVVGRSFSNQTRPDAPPSSTQVVGILPPDFLFPSPSGNFKPEVLVAMAAPSPFSVTSRWLYGTARVPGDLPVADVERRLGDATREVAKLYPPPPPGRPAAGPYDVIHLVPIRLALTWRTRPMFTTIFLTAAALMLLACVNLAGLAGAWMQDRQHELALRRALGASRGDLLRLAGIESAVAIFTGAGLGLLLATLLFRVVHALMPSYVLLKTPAIDIRVIGFCALASALSVAVVTL